MTKIYTQEELAGLDGLIGNIRNRIARIEEITALPGTYVLGYIDHPIFIQIKRSQIGVPVNVASVGLELATVRSSRTGWPRVQNGAGETPVVTPFAHAKVRALKAANECLDLLIAARNDAVLGEVAA